MYYRTDLRPCLKREQPNLFSLVEDVSSIEGTFFGRKTFILQGECAKKVQHIDYVNIDGLLYRFDRCGMTDSTWGQIFYAAFIKI